MTLHSLAHLFDDSEAQTHSIRVKLLSRALNDTEVTEQLVKMFLLDSASSVLNRNNQGLRRRFVPDLELDRALCRELEGVGEVVSENLLQAIPV